MKVTFETDAFRQAWAPLAKVPSARSPSPVLQCVLLEMAGNFVAATARNEVMAAARNLAGDCDDVAGGLLLPAEGFDRIVRTAKGDTIAVESADSSATVRSGGARFTLRTQDPALFPRPSPSPTGRGIEVATADFGLLARRTAPFDDPHSSRYAGCSVEYGAGTLAFSATDDRRVARQEVPAVCFDDQGDRRWLLPTRALAPLAALMDGPEVHAFLPNARLAHFVSGPTHAEVRLCEGRPPGYRLHDAVAEGGTRVGLDLGDFAAAVAQAAITTGEESNGIRFRFTPGALLLSSGRAGFGEGVVELPLAYEGPPATTTIAARLLEGAFRTLKAGDPLEVQVFADPGSPLVFRSGGFLFAVMPLDPEVCP